MIISQATMEDVDWIAEVTATDMISLHGTAEILDTEYMKDSFIPHVVSHGVLLVAKEKEQPIGCISGVVVPAIYNPQKKVLAELCWWVHADFRNGTVGARLLSRFEASAKSLDVDYINMTILPNTELNTEALERRGYMHKESSYMMEI